MKGTYYILNRMKVPKTKAIITVFTSIPLILRNSPSSITATTTRKIPSKKMMKATTITSWKGEKRLKWWFMCFHFSYYQHNKTFYFSSPSLFCFFFSLEKSRWWTVSRMSNFPIFGDSINIYSHSISRIFWNIY